MTALVLYVSERYLPNDKKKALVSAAKSSLVEGLHMDDNDIVVVLENFADENSNERVKHCFFPVLYTPEGTPYSYRRKIGELMNERLRKLFGEDEICHTYFHMKEHGYDNVADEGILLKFDISGIQHLDKTRGVDSMPWLQY